MGPPSATESSPPATDAVDTSLARGAPDTPPPSTDTDTALLTTVDTPLPSWPGLPRVSTDTSVMARGRLRLSPRPMLTTDTDTDTGTDTDTDTVWDTTVWDTAMADTMAMDTVMDTDTATTDKWEAFPGACAMYFLC